MIPIRTIQQRSVLDQAKAFARGGSLITAHKSYREQVHAWEYQTARAGLSQTHGLRHAYAQQRYFELTTHYSAPEIEELVEATERVCEKSRTDDRAG